MNIEIALLGEGATEQITHSLQNWIQRERIQEITVERKTSKPKQGQMGIDLIAVLSVVLSSTVIVELIKSIHVWITTTRPKKLTIKLKNGDKELQIDAENLDEQQALVDKVLERLVPRPSIEE